MELYKISNSYLTIVVSSFGAELQSITDYRGNEYLFNGNPTYWKRRSPVLFPIVGKLYQNHYLYGNNVYEMSQHGFARDYDFSLLKQDDTSISFQLLDNESTLKVYPFHFRLIITYKLRNNNLDVEWEIQNLDDKKVMYYSIGGHPAFIFPFFKRDDCYVKFDSVPSKITDLSSGFANENFNVIDRYEFGEDKTLKINNDLFKYDAIVIEDYQLSKISLCNPDKKPFLDVIFSCPIVGVWAPYKDGCPFICIEPWYGRCDSIDYQGFFKDKKWMNSLDGHSSDKFYYTIVFHIK